VIARDVPALGGRTIELQPAKEAPAIEALDSDAIENDRFRVETNEHGVTRILDRRAKRDLIDFAHFYAGELILEHDYGDPWATRRPDHFRDRLSPFTRRTGAQRIPGGFEIAFEGKHPCNFHDFEVNWLTWTTRVRLLNDLPSIEFLFDVDFDTHNRRLRAAFPTCFHTDLGDYEIPYGTLRRKRYDVRDYGPNGVNGDWPVTQWAAPAASPASVAVINRGECSYRIEGGNVLVSLVRSPTTPWCMYEPEYYRMPLFDGMRDSGVHHFHLTLFPFEGDWRDAGVTEYAWSCNAPLLAAADTRVTGEPPLVLDARGTMISTVKRAEDGDALIVRLYEYAGRGETVRLSVPDGFRNAHSVNLLERQPQGLKTRDGRVTVDMAPFKLATVRFQR
jgi:alpha-mannosidase